MVARNHLPPSRIGIADFDVLLRLKLVRLEGEAALDALGIPQRQALFVGQRHGQLAAAHVQHLMEDDRFALHHVDFRVQIAHVNQHGRAIPLLGRHHQKRRAQRGGQIARHRDIEHAHQLGDVIHELALRQDVGDLSAKRGAVLTQRQKHRLAAVHRIPRRRTMQHDAILADQVQPVGHRILHCVDVLIADGAVRTADRNLGFLCQHRDVLAGHADINLPNALPRLEFRRRYGVFHRFHKFFRRVPVSVAEAVVQDGTRADDLGALGLAALGDDRHHLGGAEIHHSRLCIRQIISPALIYARLSASV